MLYKGHLVIADTFIKNWPNHGQTLIENSVYRGHFYSGHLLKRTLFFEHHVNILGKIYALIADTLWLVGKIENTYLFSFEALLYFNMKLIIYFFQAIFHPGYNSCISLKSHTHVFFHKKPVKGHCTESFLILLWF